MKTVKDYYNENAAYGTLEEVAGMQIVSDECEDFVSEPYFQLIHKEDNGNFVTVIVRFNCDNKSNRSSLNNGFYRFKVLPDGYSEVDYINWNNVITL